MPPTRKGLDCVRWRAQPKGAKFETGGGKLKKEAEPVNLMTRLNEGGPGSVKNAQQKESLRFESAVQRVMSATWQKVADKLPVQKTEADRLKRNQLFLKWDKNFNGMISLAEIDRGLHEITGLENLQHSKAVLIRAFNAAKGLKPGRKGSMDDDFVNKSEFRMLMVFLKLYFGLYQIFKCIDTGGDRKIDAAEFRAAAPSLREWFCPIAPNPDVTFAKIDSNDDGKISFDDFCEWAVSSNQLDMGHDDPDLVSAAGTAKAPGRSPLVPLVPEGRSFSEPVGHVGAGSAKKLDPSRASVSFPPTTKPNSKGSENGPPQNPKVIYLVRTPTEQAQADAASAEDKLDAEAAASPFYRQQEKKGIGLWRHREAKGSKKDLVDGIMEEEEEEESLVNAHRSEMTMQRPNRHKSEVSIPPQQRRKMQAVPVKALGSTALTKGRAAKNAVKSPLETVAWG